MHCPTLNRLKITRYRSQELVELRLLALDIDPTTILAIPGTVAKPEQWNEIALRHSFSIEYELSGSTESHLNNSSTAKNSSITC